MEKVKKTIRLDVSLAPAVSERVVAYQTENEGRSIEIKLFNNGTDYNYTGDGAIYIDKGDGNIIYKALVFEDGKADYTLTDNDVAVVGVKIAEIRLTPNTILDDTVIVASQFEIEVRRSIYSEKAVESTSEGAAILRAAVVAEAAAVQTKEQAQSSFDAASTAEGFAKSAEAAAVRAEAAIQNVVIKKKWEAINDITLTDAMNAVEVTLPFTENKYTGVIVDIEVAGGGTYADQKARVNIIPNSQQWGINWPVSILGATPYTKVYYEFQNGAWQGWSQKEVAGSGSTTHTMNNINTIYFADDDWIKKVIVNCNNSADKFPVGTRIRLWGVK